MSGSLIAVARTPWAPRHTSLEGHRPEELLGAALIGVARRAGVEPEAIDRILVACDTSVGAQDLNLGRRAALGIGWERTPALTVDGQGVGGLALVGLAAQLPGLTVVAGVDASSLVPPGAGLVRDYGRPALEAPDHQVLDRWAQARGLDTATLDEAVETAQRAAVLTNPSIVEIESCTVVADTAVRQERSAAFVSGGVVAPHHLAPWADGAVAALIGSADGRPIDHWSFEAVPEVALIDRLSAPGNDVIRLVADNSAPVAALSAPLPSGVASPLAIGSAPSCDGLRVLADAASVLDEAFEVRTRGGHGQIAVVSVGACGLGTKKGPGLS